LAWNTVLVMSATLGGASMESISSRGGLGLIILWGLNLLLAVPAYAAPSPCEQIRLACKNSGFVQGGGRAGDGLEQDCFNPIVQGTAQPRGASRPLPQIDPRWAQACRAGNAGSASTSDTGAPSSGDRAARSDRASTEAITSTGGGGVVGDLQTVNARGKMHRRARAIMHQAAPAEGRAGEALRRLAIRLGVYRPAECRRGCLAIAACSV
jgi:hypothetical protein